MTRLTVLVAACAVAGVAAHAAQDVTADDSARMGRKLAVLTARGNLPPDRLGAPVTTSFTDREVNAYFRFDGHDRLPPGVLDPHVTIVDESRIDAQAVVDLDAVRKSQPQGMLAALMHGNVDVKVSARLEVSHGKGVVTVNAASIGGISVPPSLLQSIVNQYTRNPDLPDGFQLDKPFDLPANIRDVRLQRGAVTIVQ